MSNKSQGISSSVTIINGAQPIPQGTENEVYNIKHVLVSAWCFTLLFFTAWLDRAVPSFVMGTQCFFAMAHSHRAEGYVLIITLKPSRVGFA